MKRKILILILAVLAVAMCFSACKDEPIENIVEQLSVKSIEVVSGSYPAEIEVGQKLDLSGLKVKVIYEDDSNKEIGFSDVQVSSVDTSTPGSKTVTVTYGMHTATFKINVIDKNATLQDIQIVASSVASSVKRGKVFDVSGLQVEGLYSDGTVRGIAIADVVITNIDTSTAGDKTLKVTYQGMEDTITIKVIDITGIRVYTDSIASKIAVGERLDTSKIAAEITYADNTTEKVEAHDLTVGTIDTSTHGKKDLTINYKGFEIKYSIEVVGPVSITVRNNPEFVRKIKVFEALDTSKIQVEVEYSDGTKDTLRESDLTIDPIDTDTAGVKVLTVKFGSLSATAEIEVVGVKSMSLITDSVKSEILKGETFSAAGIQASVVYTDDTNDVIEADALKIEGTVDTNTAGEQKIKVTYLDKTIEHTVKVCDITSISVEGIPETFQAGKPLDISGMKVYGIYNDRSNTRVEITSGYTTNYDELNFNEQSEKEFTVTYGTIVKKITIGATAPELDSIKISAYAVTVRLNEEYNKASVKITAKYGNNTEREIASGFEVSDITTTTAGKQTLTVTYQGKTATAEVTVLGVKDITVVTGSVADEILKGNTFNLDGIQAIVTYEGDDAHTITVDRDDLTIEGTVDVNTAGEQTIRITYLDKTIEYTVKVCDVIGIEVVGAPQTFIAGEEINTDNMKVYAVYNDKKGTKIDVTADITTNIPNIDINEQADHEIIVTYGEFTSNFTIGANAPLLEEIYVNVYEDSVLFGEVYDKSIITIIAKYGNNTRNEITQGFTVSDIDTNTVGKQILTVTYTEGGIERPATVEVTVVGVDSLTVNAGTVNNEIIKGQTFDVSGIKATVKYTDGTTGTLDASKLTLGTINTSVAGEQKLSVTYLDKTVEYTVKVCVVTSIRVEGIPATVQAGKTLDLTGMKVYGIYNNTAHSETAEPLNNADVTTNESSLNLSVVGEKTLVITYSGEQGSGSCEFDFEVTAPDLTGIVVDTAKSNLSVRVGEDFNKNGIVVEATYGNGSKKNVTDFTVSAVDTNTAGDKTVTVTYTENGVTKTATATVTVIGIKSIAVSQGTLPTVINKGETINTSGVKVIVTYTDDSTKTVTEGINVSVPATLTPGDDNDITVTYKGVSVTHKCHVRAVTAIEIYAGLADVKRDGYATDVSALQIKIKYSDGTEEVKFVKDLTGVTYTGLEAGNTAFSVTYEGKTASKTLVVAAIYQVHALNGTVPGYVLQGNKLSFADFRLTVVYKYEYNGEDREEVYLLDPATDDRLIVSPTEDQFDTTTPGDRIIQFTYILDPNKNPMQDGYALTAAAKVVVVGVSSIEIVPGTILTTVNKGQELDYSTLQVRVNYTDGTYKYVNRSDLKAVSNVDINTAGVKTLTVTYGGYNKDFTSSIDINVIEVTADASKGMIFAAVLPDDIVVRDTYKKNFKIQDSPYYVGDDNPFILYLNVAVLDENKKLVEVDGLETPTAVKVYENGVELTGDALNSVVSFDSSKNSYDFTEAAIGRTFKLEISPAETHRYTDKNSVTKSHTVTIVDGYNVYHAYELNLINNGFNSFEGVGMTEGIRFSQNEAVDKFLVAKGISEYKNPNLAGVILHKNIDIKPEDLPPEYIVTYTKDGQTYEGLVDAMGIFTKQLAVGQSFSIYGNYYSIFSYNIPPVAHQGYGNNNDPYSSSTLFELEPSNATLEQYGKDNPFPHESLKFNIMDLALRDNDPHSNDQSASERHMRGLSAFQVGGSEVNVTNVNVDAFMMSLSTEEDNLTLNLNKVKFYNAWQGHLFLWSNNALQEACGAINEAPWNGIFGIKVNITDSLLGKCGGPVILAQNAYRDDRDCNKGLSIDVNVDSTSELFSYVTGEEAWFVAVNQVPLAKKIILGNMLITGYSDQYYAKGLLNEKASFVSDDKIAGVPTVNMIMVCMGDGDLVGGDIADHRGSLTFNGTQVFNMKVGEGENTELKDMITANGANKTIFQSPNGGIAYHDPDNNTLGPNYGPYPGPNPSLFTGDYLNIYTSGIGILLEYYHPAE